MGKSLCSVADIIKRKNITVHAIDTFQGSLGKETINRNHASEYEFGRSFLKKPKEI
jgi:hypothetical protein